MKPVVLNWSSGKDAALAYYLLQKDPDYDVLSLFTTLSGTFDRVSMHGTRKEILEKQALLMNMPLVKMALPELSGMEDYNEKMREAVNGFKEKGIDTFSFGDIFLDDLKQYRENQLASVDAKAIFPLWKMDTRNLISLLEATGIVAKIICVNDRVLDTSFLGRTIDTSLLNDLPTEVDPCGENGEFHTLVTDAPFFSSKLEVAPGEIVHRKYESETGHWDNGFYYLDMKLSD